MAPNLRRYFLASQAASVDFPDPGTPGNRMPSRFARFGRAVRDKLLERGAQACPYPWAQSSVRPLRGWQAGR